jgi:hypothetical protein
MSSLSLSFRFLSALLLFFYKKSLRRGKARGGLHIHRVIFKRLAKTARQAACIDRLLFFQYHGVFLSAN